MAGAGVQLMDEPVALFQYQWTSEVAPNLRVKAYHAIIFQARPACWQRIAQAIQNSRYTELEQDLKEGQFADLRQAAMYIPWALLQRDDFTAATDARKAYNEFNAHIQDLQSAALAAAAGDADPQRVQQSFILMSASLDGFLAAVPSTYLGNGPKA